MSVFRHLGALLLCAGIACSNRATIGGLCREHCERFDAGHDACAGNSCRRDAGMVDAGSPCREGSYVLDRMRLDLVLIVDDAASLAPWWPALHDGLDQFLHANESSGVGVGLQRFDEVCETQPYAQLIVPIAPLPGNALAVEDAAALMPTASTSTVPALDGVLGYARTWALSHADARVVVVLLTDAAPGACDGLLGDYNAQAQRIARAAYEATPSLKSYVVGFGVMTDALSLIAQAGGSEPRLISVTPADGEVLAALDSVRKDAQPCAFAWPNGWTLAPSSAVVATASDGTQHRYEIHDNSSACDAQGGFYVQDPSRAYPLIACPRVCEGLGASPQLALSAACSAP